MNAFFKPNINGWGRLVRFCWGLLLLVVAYLFRTSSPWWDGLLALSAAFGFYEAARGWCVMRACGIKTRF